MTEQSREIIVTEDYKMYEGFKYHLNFPDEWILNELPETGRKCANCVGYRQDGKAMWRGIILGYCCNCATEYEGSRCIGFYGHGVEIEPCPEKRPWKSAFNIYLKSLDRVFREFDFENFGDINDNVEDTMENHEMILAEITCISNDIYSNPHYENTRQF